MLTKLRETITRLNTLFTEHLTQTERSLFIGVCLFVGLVGLTMPDAIAALVRFLGLLGLGVALYLFCLDQAIERDEKEPKDGQ